MFIHIGLHHDAGRRPVQWSEVYELLGDQLPKQVAAAAAAGIRGKGQGQSWGWGRGRFGCSFCYIRLQVIVHVWKGVTNVTEVLAGGYSVLRNVGYDNTSWYLDNLGVRRAVRS